MMVIFTGRNSIQHLNTGVTTMDTMVRMENLVRSLVTMLIILSVRVCQGMNPSLRRIGITEMVLRVV